MFKEKSALVIALDLSRSMDANDIKPSRLARARHKISDILKLRREGQTGLIAYAAEAFTVSPLTDDTATIHSLVPSLSTDIMPAQGSNTSRALERASELLKNSGVNRGDVLLVTDGIENSAKEAVENLKRAGHRLSILALGTAEGAPIPTGNGGFVKNQNGAIVIPKLDSKNLTVFAKNGNGRFASLSPSDRDIKYLQALFESNRNKNGTTKTELKTDTWHEQGPWLLLLVIPLAALAFRKGYISLAFALLIPWPQSADALSWDELWRNDNQRGLEQFKSGNTSQAAQTFSHPEWKASAHYRAGEFEKSIEQLKNIDSADAHYNRGNALAKMNRLEEAIDAYKQALEIDSQHEDAKHNKELIEQQQQQQQQQQENKQQNGNTQADQQHSDQQQQSEQQNASQQDDQQTDQQQAQQDKQNQDEQSQNESRQQQQSESRESEQQPPADQQTAASEAQQDLSEQAKQQWLKKVPDDPGGLLRNKFRYQYNRQGYQSDANQPW